MLVLFSIAAFVVSTPVLLADESASSSGGIGLPSPDDPRTIAWAIMVLFGVVGALNQTLDVFKKLFPKESPPAHEKYATKAEIEALIIELNDLESDHDEDLKRLETRLENALAKEADFRQRVEHALGRIEAKLESKR